MDKEGEYISWVSSAKLDLLDYENNLGRKEYHRCLFFLQQACEKTAKATMISISFASDTGLSQILNILGIPTKTPKSYGHNWRKNFIIQVEKIIKNPMVGPWIEALRSQGLKNPQTTIYNAKMVEDLKNPNYEKVSEIINFCTILLDKLESQEFNDGIDKFRPTIKKLVELTKTEVEVQKSVDSLMLMVKRVFSLDVLMILSTLLSPFNEMRYPSDKNVEAFVPKLNDIETTLQRCISFVERK